MPTFNYGENEKSMKQRRHRIAGKQKAAEMEDLYEQGIELTEEEATSDYWYIYFADPESEIAYYLSLDARQFSKEQAIEIAKSVRFKEMGE